MRQMLKGINEMKDELEQAVLKDLGRCPFFTEIGELNGIKDYCEYFIEHVDEFSKDTHFDPPLLLAPNTNWIRWEPLGVCLVYGSWNYPYYVNLKPVVQAIATGNCAVVKPSEMSPASSAACQKLVDKYLDNRCYRVI